MIYLDTSVALAHLLAEDRVPPVSIWSETLVSSRLLQYEVWTSIHGQGLAGSHGSATQALLERIAMLELSPVVLGRALEPFPTRVRTLDALHLASIEFLRSQKQPCELATYDERMQQAAIKLAIPLSPFCRMGKPAGREP